ncbi:MAG: hypothetical protein LBP99_05360 [Azoarcus sp.]|jgi:hypothetical protein|nr:hypothetical protein [Azoarcus sp.]
MTRLALVVPGLIWPSPQALHPAGEIPHAALARLLGRGQWRMEPAISFDDLLARLLGRKRALPLAALRRLGEEGGHVGEHAQDDENAHWLCADPVNLSFMGAHVLLDEFNEDEGEIDAAEATALVASLNEEFAGLGHFWAATPTRWYLRMGRPAKARFFPLDEAVCRPVQDYLPTEGENGENDARHWRHMLNEIQVMLHNHPVNIAREAAGRRPVNSVWFWGSGIPSLPDTPDMTGCAVQTADPVACGLARTAGIEPEALDVGRALRVDTLAVLGTLAFSARHLDFMRWQDALAALEQEWFVPVARAFDGGGLRSLVLHVPGERAGFSLTLGGGARWRFWRKPLPLPGLPLT